LLKPSIINTRKDENLEKNGHMTCPRKKKKK